MAVPRIRKCQTPQEFQSTVDDFHTQGFIALRQGDGNALLRKGTWGSVGGHVLVFVLAGWWTFFVANVIYALVAHFGAEKVFVKLEQDLNPPPPARPDVPRAERPY